MTYLKKVICIFIFTIASATFSLGQPTTWAKPGAHWYYTIGDSVPIGYYGYYELWEDGDTLFSNGITCDILRTHEKAIQFWNFNAVYENYGPDIYTYMSNDTVYCYYQNQFHVLFINNIQPGQSWITGTDVINLCPGDTIVMDSVMSVTINSFTMNRYVPVVPTWVGPFGEPSIYFHSPIFERFGSTGFFLPAPMCVTDISYGPIRCYIDSSFNFNTNVVPICDYITSVNDEISTKSILSIIPNASIDEIIIQVDPWLWKQDELYEIISAEGSILQQFELHDNYSRFNISHLASGMYWLKIKNRPQMKPVSFIKL